MADEDQDHPVVLLVEDDALLLKLTRAALLSRGFEVLVATSGEEALHRFDQAGVAVKVALVDNSLPGLFDGFDVSQRLRQRRPDLPVLLASGYDVASLVEKLQQSGPTRFLAKPFGPDGLFEALDDLLTPASR